MAGITQTYITWRRPTTQLVAISLVDVERGLFYRDVQRVIVSCRQMVAPHSGVLMIEASQDQEVYSPYFVVEQNEQLSIMLQDNARNYWQLSYAHVL